jgi:hypothetical protein
MSYRRRQAKLTRVSHEVRVCESFPASAVKADLAQVPDGAKLTDWETEGTTGMLLMIFIEETEEAAG